MYITCEFMKYMSNNLLHVHIHIECIDLLMQYLSVDSLHSNSLPLPLPLPVCISAYRRLCRIVHIGCLISFGYLSGLNHLQNMLICLLVKPYDFLSNFKFPFDSRLFGYMYYLSIYLIIQQFIRFQFCLYQLTQIVSKLLITNF